MVTTCLEIKPWTHYMPSYFEVSQKLSWELLSLEGASQHQALPPKMMAKELKFLPIHTMLMLLLLLMLMLMLMLMLLLLLFLFLLLLLLLLVVGCWLVFFVVVVVVEVLNSLQGKGSSTLNLCCILMQEVLACCLQSVASGCLIR